MKKLIFIILMAVCSVAAWAQKYETTAASMQRFTAQGTAVTLDTLTNADTSYLYFLASAAYDAHIVATVTKISGTLAGTLCLQGSDVGGFTNSNWDTVNNVVAGPTVSNYYDYQTLGNATSSFDWFYTGPTIYHYKYLRVRLITSGTNTSSFTGTAYYRKPNP